MKARIDDNVPVPGDERPLSEQRGRDPVHPARAFETYELEDADKEDDRPWVRPTSLEAPPPRPGFVQRWVRVAFRDEDDATNASRKFREGWKPRPADTVPPSHQVPTISHGKWAGAVGIEGMVLCEMPKPMAEKRRKHFADETARRTNAIEDELQAQSRPGMEITQHRRSSVVREVKLEDGAGGEK